MSRIRMVSQVGLSPKPGFSPDDRPGAKRIMEAVRGNMVFQKGHITPKIAAGARRDFERWINIFDPPALANHIREDFGCGEGLIVKSCATQSGPYMGEQTFKIALLEKTFELGFDCYNGEFRKSGHKSVSHPLRAGAFAAAVGAPFKTIILSLIHDLPEDVLDEFAEKIAFRLRDGNNEIYTADEGSNAREIFRHIHKNYGRHGKQLSQSLRAITRFEKIPEGKSYNRAYLEYLIVCYSNIHSAFAKAADSIANLNENPSEMTILKVAWQVKRWQKISWIVADLLLSGIERHSKGTKLEGIEKKLRDVSEWHICKFELGWTENEVRGYLARLFNTVSRSGSPVIDLYRASQRNPNRFEIEIPFVDEAIGRDLISAAFGIKASQIARATSILPTRLTSAMLFKFECKDTDIPLSMAEIVYLYDALLSRGQLLPALSGFDRKEWTAAARDRMARVLDERSLNPKFL